MKTEVHPCSGDGCLTCRDLENRKQGRKDVVEWIEKNSDKTEICEDKGEFPGLCFYLKQWQAYLKKEGLK